MKCPFCGHLEDRVIDSRTAGAGEAIRRRRECLSCTRRFTTYERLEESVASVVKRDGRREPFDRNKLLKGLKSACAKRPIPMEQLTSIADSMEQFVHEREEVEASALGERVMERLRDLDEIAFVRFASVYRRFRDVGEFAEALGTLSRK